MHVMILHIGRALRFGSVLSLFLLAAGWSVAVQAQVKLEHKFVEGQKTVIHTTMKVNQTLTLAGMGLDTKTDRFVITSAQVGQRDAEGKVRIEQKTDKLSASLKLPGGIEVSFDSDDPNKKVDNPALEPLMQLMRASAKAKITMVRDSSGKVVAVEGLDKVADEVSGELKGEFNPEQAKKAANQELENLPSDAVKPGDTWTKVADLPLGSGQVMNMTTEYKYVGEVKEGDKTFDKIEAKTTAVSFSIAADSKLPLKVTKSELKPTESAETKLFDRAAGQWHSIKAKIRIQGTLDFEINGMPLPGKLDLTIESEVVRQPK
jgi:hypothetical protein